MGKQLWGTFWSQQWKKMRIIPPQPGLMLQLICTPASCISLKKISCLIMGLLLLCVVWKQTALLWWNRYYSLHGGTSRWLSFPLLLILNSSALIFCPSRQCFVSNLLPYFLRFHCFTHIFMSKVQPKHFDHKSRKVLIIPLQLGLILQHQSCHHPAVLSGWKAASVCFLEWIPIWTDPILTALPAPFPQFFCQSNQL